MISLLRFEHTPDFFGKYSLLDQVNMIQIKCFRLFYVQPLILFFPRFFELSTKKCFSHEFIAVVLDFFANVITTNCHMDLCLCQHFPFLHPTSSRTFDGYLRLNIWIMTNAWNEFLDGGQRFQSILNIDRFSNKF